MWNIETTTKFARLKGISSIEDAYIEAAKDCNTVVFLCILPIF